MNLDESRRYLQPRPVAIALMFLAGLSFVLWAVSRSTPQLLLPVAIVAALVADALLARLAISDVKIHVDPPILADVGEPLVTMIRVTGLRGPVVVGPAIAPRRSHVVVERDDPGLIRIPAMNRGIAQSVVLDAAATGPLGLFTAARRYAVRFHRVIEVAPMAMPFEAAWPEVRAVRFGNTETAPVGDDLFRSIRPYVRGDSVRRVHWKATARHGELMVKESDGTGITALRVVVDLDRPGPGAETAVQRAAWLVSEGLRRGWLVRLVTLAPRQTPVEPAFALGSPLGPPPRIQASAPAPLRLLDQRVPNLHAARRQLAVAGFGTMTIPEWRGTTCVVTPRGDRWQ
jgi:uncharacterized protein (DUF58 family)